MGTTQVPLESCAPPTPLFGVIQLRTPAVGFSPLHPQLPGPSTEAWETMHVTALGWAGSLWA